MSIVGFVGLGDMGSRMVPHLLGANHQVVVFDVIRDRLDAMTAPGAVAADSAAAAAHDADVVISAVMSADIPAARPSKASSPECDPKRRWPCCRQQVRTCCNRLRRGCQPAFTSSMPRSSAVHSRGRSLVDGAAGWSRRSDGADRADLGIFGDVVRVGPLGSGVAYKLITNVVVMAAEAGSRGPRPGRHSRRFVPDHARPPRPWPDGGGCQAGVGSRQSSGHSRIGN